MTTITKCFADFCTPTTVRRTCSAGPAAGGDLDRSRTKPVLLAAVPASAEVDLSGSWAARNHEDSQLRFPGPLAVDYTGLPLNEGGRARALSYSQSQLSEPERVCLFYAPVLPDDWTLRHAACGAKPIRSPATWSPGTSADGKIARRPPSGWTGVRILRRTLRTKSRVSPRECGKATSCRLTPRTSRRVTFGATEPPPATRRP